MILCRMSDAAFLLPLLGPYGFFCFTQDSKMSAGSFKIAILKEPQWFGIPQHEKLKRRKLKRKRNNSSNVEKGGGSALLQLGYFVDTALMAVAAELGLDVSVEHLFDCFGILDSSAESEEVRVVVFLRHLSCKAVLG